MTREERARGRGRRRLRPRIGLKPQHSRLVLQVAGGAAGLLVLLLALNRLLGGDMMPAAGPGGSPGPEVDAEWQITMEEAARRAALSAGLRASWVVVYPPGSPEGDSLLTVMEFRVPGDLHIEVLNLALSRAVESCGGTIVRGVELNDARVELDVAYGGRRTHRFILQRYSGYSLIRGRIGLIIDDWGRVNESIAEAFTRLQIPWTASVIPEPGVSAAQARYLSEQGIPLMVHMPMEPVNGAAWDLGDGAIYADTPPAEVASLLDAALAETPGARGVNNHMGSLATTRPRVMRALMEALRERALFFIDSRTTPASVGAEEARKAGVPWAARDIFLDSEDDPDVIEQQFQRALEHARESGSVILIGHPRPNTLAVLARRIAAAHDDGFDFVTVDRLLRRPGRKR